MTAHVIEVMPASAGSGPISWTMLYKNTNQTGGPPDYVAVDLAKDHSDQVFVFIIRNPPGLDVKFAPTIEDAIWIQQDEKPTNKVLEPSSQIREASRVSDSILVFIDKNSGSSKLLKYRLNFVNGSGASVTPIDPDIRNGGGKTGSFGPRALAFVAGASVSLVLTALWFTQLGPSSY